MKTYTNHTANFIKALEAGPLYFLEVKMGGTNQISIKTLDDLAAGKGGFYFRDEADKRTNKEPVSRAFDAICRRIARDEGLTYAEAVVSLPVDARLISIQKEFTR